MNFKELIEYLENKKENNTYLIKNGVLPIILTAPHTMIQEKEDGTIKLDEPYTKAIAQYVSEKTNCSHLIKVKDTHIDSNKENIDEFKLTLIKLIKEHNIKLLIDIHGASRNRDFDIELGTLNNLSADYSTIEELKDSFIEQDIKNIEINNPFKGGGITQYIFQNTDIDIIQIEINRNYRDINKVENIEKICNALINFIKQYSNFQG